ncbi:hypothetical protein [Silvanigrella aquatica]|uniref:Uncharacterized protein n=1 Tax=Silvanigrella aquatica TaxID=1915309 RepID=A0A1L4CZ32_9BACT|nr:hypothetical protein [Silvanigrella aquatica]APJ03223.1 hypothetical protein AXG55_04615 [Silvanigrella aquatica]
MIINHHNSKLISMLPDIAISQFDTWNVNFTDIIDIKMDKSKLKQSKFLNPGEGMIYSDLIAKVIETKTRLKYHQIRLIDLGSGSSLPTIAALLKYKD